MKSTRVLTLTPNTALDRVFIIDSFEPGVNNTALETLDCVGGKGLDAALVLAELGVEQLALGFTAGKNGALIRKLLDDRNIPHRLVEVPGETRIAHVIVEKQHHRHTHIMTGGYQVSRADVKNLLSDLAKSCQDSGWVITGGSLPKGSLPSFYGTLVREARRNGVSSLVDAAGKPALMAVKACPDILKMNHREFAVTFGIHTNDMKMLARAIMKISHDNSLPALVVTCGRSGIMAASGGQCWMAIAPTQTELNAAGAGDAVSAALVWRLSLGDEWQRALSWAAAAGAAVALTAGTADCRFRDIKRIQRQVKVGPCLD